MQRPHHTRRQLSVASVLLLLGITITIACFFGGSSWDVVFADLSGDDIVEITQVQAAAEWPLSAPTFEQLRTGKPPPTAPIPIKIENKGARRSSLIPAFHKQLMDGLKLSGHRLDEDLSGQRYAFFVDIPIETFRHVSNPSVFYLTIWSPYELYIDGRLALRSGGRKSYLSGAQILNLEGPSVRLLWIVENSYKDWIGGLHFRHGLSIRSDEQMRRTYERYPVQVEFPRIVSAWVLFTIGIFALSLAAGAREYIDVWAFASLCLTSGLSTWMQSPIFYDTFTDRGDLLASISVTVTAFVVISAAALTLAFFRLEGREVTTTQWIDAAQAALGGDRRRLLQMATQPFAIIFAATTALSALAVLRFWPSMSKLPPYAVIANTNLLLSHILIASQLTALALGARSLWRLHRHYRAAGLHAQLRLMRMRLVLAAIFTGCMGLMLFAYAQGLGTVSLEVGSDTILLAALFPALAMLLLFQWMLTSAKRFYQRFAPRLGQIDHEVMAFGATALERRYQGTLLVFDLAGMKRLNEIRNLGADVESAVDGLIARVEAELSRLVQAGHIAFRYKSNGDEFIFAMRAADLDAARRQMAELTARWVRIAERAIGAWREQLERDLLQTRKLAPERIHAVTSHLDIHVLITTMHAMKITVKGGVERPTAAPDFVEARFTALSALFKPTTHSKVAMYADDAALALEHLADNTAGVHFESVGATAGDEPAMGFLTWSSAASNQLEPLGAAS